MISWWFGLVVWDSNRASPFVTIRFMRGTQESKTPTQATNLLLADIFTYMYNEDQPFISDVGKYTSPMNPMGNAG